MNPRNNVPVDLLFLFTLQHSKLTQSHNLHERPSVHVWPAITQTGPFTRTFVFPSWSKISFYWFKNCIFLLNFGISIWENIPSLFLRSGFLRSCYCFSLASLLNLFWGQPNGLGNQRLNFCIWTEKGKKKETNLEISKLILLKKKQETSRKRQETPKTQHQGRNKKILWKNLPQFGAQWTCRNSESSRRN